MQKLVLIVVVVITCLPAMLYAAGRGRGGKSGGDHGGAGHGDGHHRNCGQWTDGQCVPSNNATCGAGHQTKTRTGDNCPVKEKTTKCHVPCPTPVVGEAAPAAAAPVAAAGGRGGNGRGRKASKRCDYIKGDWTECDGNTNQRSRTFTLNTAAGEQPAHCKQTKTIRKKCPSANKNRANRGGRGEGRNSRGN